LYINSYATYNIAGDNGVSICKKSKVFDSFYQNLMATELQLAMVVVVLVMVVAV